MSSIVNSLENDPRINWDEVITEMRKSNEWALMRKRPRYHIIRSFVTPGRFPNGGDRISADARERHRRTRELLNKDNLIHLESDVQNAAKRTFQQPERQHAQTSAPVSKKMKTEERTRDEFAVDVGLCGNERCRLLARRIESIRPYSNITEKRKQRNEILARVADALSLTASTGRDVLVWYLDDILPLTEGDTAATSLSMDLLLRFGGASGCRLRLFTPNLKRSIVDHVRSLQPLMESGRLVTGVGCVCSFNARWCSEICMHGGLDVVMLDGFGGLRHGVQPILQQMVDLQLLRVAPISQPVPLMIVLSDRADRAEHGSVLKATLRMCIDVPRLFHGNPTYNLHIDSEEAYGTTMHVLRCSLYDREYARSDLPGCVGHITYDVSP